jgi:hypothetical protein
MEYPTLDEVKAANKRQLAIWYRFLPSPGDTVHHRNINYPDILINQTEIMSAIHDRFIKEMGGFTPELSKDIGWERRRYE